jgi:hypothetical protein
LEDSDRTSNPAAGKSGVLHAHDTSERRERRRDRKGRWAEAMGNGIRRRACGRPPLERGTGKAWLESGVRRGVRPEQEWMESGSKAGSPEKPSNAKRSERSAVSKGIPAMEPDPYPLAPQHFLYFFPLPHGHGSFRPGPLSLVAGACFRSSPRLVASRRGSGPLEGGNPTAPPC